MTELDDLIAQQQKDDTYSVRKQFNGLSYKMDGEHERFSRRSIKTPKLTFIPHGTSSGYSYHGCRCDECTRWRRNYARKERLRQGCKPRRIYDDND
jgi:hypothetical protein